MVSLALTRYISLEAVARLASEEFPGDGGWRLTCARFEALDGDPYDPDTPSGAFVEMFRRVTLAGNMYERVPPYDFSYL